MWRWLWGRLLEVDVVAEVVVDVGEWEAEDEAADWLRDG